MVQFSRDMNCHSALPWFARALRGPRYQLRPICIARRWPYARTIMRLLRRSPGGKVQLTTVNENAPPPYAILSHTWTEGEEVSYNELINGTNKDKTGYAKI